MAKLDGLYQTPFQIFFETCKFVAVAFTIAFLIRVFLVQPYYIPSGSMRNTLIEGDKIFVTKYNYGIHLPYMLDELIATGEPMIGDIIVFPYPRDTSVDFIKRVVGLPNDVIEIRSKQLYRNGKQVNESYIIHSDPHLSEDVRRDTMEAVTVPEGHVFVLGDNRDSSVDSRFWGFVDKKTIKGKAQFIFWSSQGLSNIQWDRIGKVLN